MWSRANSTILNRSENFESQKFVKKINFKIISEMLAHNWSLKYFLKEKQWIVRKTNHLNFSNSFNLTSEMNKVMIFELLWLQIKCDIIERMDF